MRDVLRRTRLIHLIDCRPDLESALGNSGGGAGGGGAGGVTA
jgi:hypothetical protein